MEASDGVVRGNVDSLMKLVDALTADGIELIGEGATSQRRRPRSAAQMMVVIALYGVAALVALAPLAIALGVSPRGKEVATSVIYGACLIVTLTLCSIALAQLVRNVATCRRRHAAARPAVAGRAFPHRRAGGVFPGGGQSRRRGGQPLCARLWPPRAFATPRAAVLSGLSRRHESRGDGERRFRFLVSWEFMSLTSWALVIAHHRVSENPARGLCLSA